jgi:2-keto-4-pentenoate hydratase
MRDNDSFAATATDVVVAAAARLLEARVRRMPCSPVRDLIGGHDVVAAYAVQQLVAEQRISEGSVVVGRKIGLTSPAVQAQLGVDQPDFGLLFDDMACRDGDVLPLDHFLQPRVEAEVAFVLRHDLVGGDLDYEQVRRSVDHAVAALEVCDSRIAGWDITFGDTVADNASAGAYVLGTRRVGLDILEPRTVSMRMTVTGQEESTGHGSACLGDPVLALQWLARRCRDLGSPLRAGETILSGALGPMRPVGPDTSVHAEISGLGTVAVQFGELGIEER